MSKRKAATDLNRDNWDKDEVVEEAGTFQRAHEEIIRGRVIRTAKRRLQGRVDQSVEVNRENEEPKKIFSGFSGFESIKSASNLTVNGSEKNYFSFLNKPNEEPKKIFSGFSGFGSLKSDSNLTVNGIEKNYFSFLNKPNEESAISIDTNEMNNDKDNTESTAIGSKDSEDISATSNSNIESTRNSENSSTTSSPDKSKDSDKIISSLVPFNNAVPPRLATVSQPSDLSVPSEGNVTLTVENNTAESNETGNEVEKTKSTLSEVQ